MNPVIILILLQGALVKDVLLMSTKTWLRNINFNNSLNWDQGRVPCSQDNVIFPRSMGIVVQFPEGETILRQLVLPLDGELLLPLNGKLQMSKPNDKNDKCQGKDIVFSQWRPSSWADPNSWSGHNLATPDIEAIPCTTDSVIFPPKASYSVIMPDTILRVAALRIAGKLLQTSDWSDMMSAEEGQTQFFTENGPNGPVIKVTGQTCTDVTGCQCNNEELKEDVCSIMKTQCRSTPCFDPVMPIGNCCPICGAYILFRYNEEFTKSNFETYLREKLSNDNIDFHVGKVDGKIQVVLFEKEYDERAQSLADEIREDVKKRRNLGLELDAEFVAGSLVYPTSFSRQVLIFFGTMLTAICMISLLFYNYFGNTCKINTQMGRQYVFFENQSEEVEICGSNGSSEIPIPKRETKRHAFDNPMYGSTIEVEPLVENLSGESPTYSVLEDMTTEKEGFEKEAVFEEELMKITE